MIKEIDIPIYDAVVNVFLTPTIRQVNTWAKPLRELEVVDDEDLNILYDWIRGNVSDDGFTLSFEHGHYGIYIRKGLEDHNTIAHEVFHCVNKILSDRGVEMTGEGEAYAYLIGYITEKIYK